MSELLPLFPLSTVLFPGMRLPLHIFEERYRLLVAHLRTQPEPRRFGVIAIRTGREVGADGITALHEVGCVAAVRQIAPHADGRFDLATVGTERFRLVRVDDSLPYYQGEIEPLEDEAVSEAGEAEALAVRRVQAGFRAYLNALADRGGGVISRTSATQPTSCSAVMPCAPTSRPVRIAITPNRRGSGCARSCATSSR